MISTTPLAEYVDLVFTRMKLAMRGREDVLGWRVELCPPVFTGEDGAGYVRIYVRTATKVIARRAMFSAVEKGAEVGMAELELVAEHHIAKLVEAMEA